MCENENGHDGCCILMSPFDMTRPTDEVEETRCDSSFMYGRNRTSGTVRSDPGSAHIRDPKIPRKRVSQVRGCQFETCRGGSSAIQRVVTTGGM